MNPSRFYLLPLLMSIYFLTISAHEKFESHLLLPRPLILEKIESLEAEELRLRCRSWRIAGEANNLSPWKTIPSECAEYVKNYMMGKGYIVDLDMVAKQAGNFAKTVELGNDGKDVWIFDVDETLLSNLPYYADHGYGMEVFDSNEFNKWVEKAVAPTITSSLELYKEVLRLGIKVILLTGRHERYRTVTVENLKNAGFEDWDKLILRQDHLTRMCSILKTHNLSGVSSLHQSFLIPREDHYPRSCVLFPKNKRRLYV